MKDVIQVPFRVIELGDLKELAVSLCSQYGDSAMIQFEAGYLYIEPNT